MNKIKAKSKDKVVKKKNSPNLEQLRVKVFDLLKTCFDPEIPVNIVDLGLIYDVTLEKLDTKKNEKTTKISLKKID